MPILINETKRGCWISIEDKSTSSKTSTKASLPYTLRPWVLGMPGGYVSYGTGKRELTLCQYLFQTLSGHFAISYSTGSFLKKNVQFRSKTLSRRIQGDICYIFFQLVFLPELARQTSGQNQMSIIVYKEKACTICVSFRTMHRFERCCHMNKSKIFIIHYTVKIETHNTTGLHT